VSIVTLIRNNLLTFVRYENCAWAPFLLVFVIATGVSGKDFVNTPTPPATVAQIFNFGATIAGYMIPWSALSSDYTAYFHPRVSRFVKFCGVLHQNLIFKDQLSNFHILVSGPHYSYCERWFSLSRNTSDGLQIALECLGAAAAISAPSVPKWDAGYAGGNVGGLLNAMLSPTGKFGKVLMVLLSLSVTTTTAPTIYSMCMAFQTFIPPLAAVPRYVLAVFAAAM
jgi:purine-cytosine permease-like protein